MADAVIRIPRFSVDILVYYPVLPVFELGNLHLEAEAEVPAAEGLFELGNLHFDGSSGFDANGYFSFNTYTMTEVGTPAELSVDLGNFNFAATAYTPAIGEFTLSDFYFGAEEAGYLSLQLGDFYFTGYAGKSVIKGGNASLGDFYFQGIEAAKLVINNLGDFYFQGKSISDVIITVNLGEFYFQGIIETSPAGVSFTFKWYETY